LITFALHTSLCFVFFFFQDLRVGDCACLHGIIHAMQVWLSCSDMQQWTIEGVVSSHAIRVWRSCLWRDGESSEAVTRTLTVTVSCCVQTGLASDDPRTPQTLNRLGSDSSRLVAAAYRLLCRASARGRWQPEPVPLVMRLLSRCRSSAWVQV
jgi:hypothetical protein